jgi:chromosome segregation ATPase
MDIVDKAKAVVGMKPKKEKTRLQIIKSENAELKKKLEANRAELRDVANTTVDGRTGDNSALERKEKELADKLVSNNREVIKIELAKIEAKFGKKEKALDAKKAKLEDKKEEAKTALDDFNKADGAYSKLKEEKAKAQSPWYEMKGRMAD